MRLKGWHILFLGLGGGFLYGLAQWYLDSQATDGRQPWPLIHSLFDWAIPVILGLVIAGGFRIYRRQKELNTRLSTEISKFRSRLLTNTFASFIMHEIRNPIHNLSAALEALNPKLESPEKEIIERNMDRLARITGQLKQMPVLSDDINVSQEVRLWVWGPDFIKNCVIPGLKQLLLKYDFQFPRAVVRIHPLLLEQCFTILLDNAIHAASAGDASRSFIQISGKILSESSQVHITFRNSGRLFPEEVLKAAGRYIVKSDGGSGMGLVLVRDTVRQAGGDLEIRNQDGTAEAVLIIPGTQK